ncbi:hypothetical protein [Schaalia hyovaginalis]|uniref:Uncharacterized protein n=1 Tax=Schaalia hyovaginalis TaxID=29316 RepID=A0A923E0X1_9ACTO|nr:hypothetical protein [Schaalia hyovaginalis]MBB6333896.1 hypothetical protein [Schaalia hyovaginalis]
MASKKNATKTTGYVRSSTGSYTVKSTRDPRTGKFVPFSSGGGKIVVAESKTKTAS